MDAYMVRQPIMNREQKVQAYEIVYEQDGSSFYNSSDGRVANAIVSFFGYVNEQDILGGKDAFLTFTPSILMRELPILLDQEKLVIQVNSGTLRHPDAKKMLQQYIDKGFRLALMDFNYIKRDLENLYMFHILKIDFSNTEDGNIQSKIELAQRLGIKTCAYNVNSEELRTKAMSFDCDLYQGTSVGEVVRSTVSKADHLHSNFFRLTAAVSGAEPDFNEIAEIIALDVTLTFSLMRIVNSAHFALPNRITEVKQALTVLGLNQLRDWIYLLSFTPDGGLSDELIKTSFMRATFCRNMSSHIKNLPILPSEAYIMGMFSTLDVLLGVSIGDSVADLPINEAVKDALVSSEGICGDLLQLSIQYEKGNWKKVDSLSASLEVSTENISAAYMESLDYVKKTWETLSRSI